jgi:DNA invertase Pin-like site-specific DNA recombinase
VTDVPRGGRAKRSAPEAPNVGDRAVLYLRQSVTDSPGDSLSIASQEAALRELAAERGYAVAGVSADHDLKGWQDEEERPGLAAALGAVREGRAGVVLVWNVSRLARDLILQERIVRDLTRRGARLESLREPWLGDPFIRQVMGAVAEADTRRISADVKRALHERVCRGLPASRVPYGLAFDPGEADPKRRRLVPDPDHPERVAMVIDLFGSYLAGEPVPAIADRLTRDGPPPLLSARWRVPVLLQMLSNPAYAGHLAFGDSFVRDAHPAIVDAATWAAVQARRASGKRPTRRKPQTSFLEGAVLHCCQAPMYLHPRNDRSSPTFRCASWSNNWRGGQRCGMGHPHASARALERAVLALLAADLDRARGVSLAMVQARADTAARDASPDLVRRRRELARRRADAEKRRAKARELWLSDRCTLEEFDADVAGADALLAAVAAEEAALPAGQDLERLRSAWASARTLGDLVRRVRDGDMPKATGMLGALVREAAVVAVGEDGAPRLAWRAPFDLILGG